MRTTVDLEPDVEQLLRDRMNAEGVSFERALNDAVRAGAIALDSASFSTTVHAMGAPRVNLDRANRLAADLENAELIAR